MRPIWESQGAGDRLVTKIWPTGHTFNLAMQDEVFDWFKKQGVPFIGAQGSKEKPVLVLMVPDHAG